jgi:hypothetical protein
VLEVALLELLREFPHHVEADWDDVVRRTGELVADGQVDLDRVLAAAVRERHPACRARARQLAGEVRTADG